MSLTCNFNIYYSVAFIKFRYTLRIIEICFPFSFSGKHTMKVLFKEGFIWLIKNKNN